MTDSRSQPITEDSSMTDRSSPDIVTELRSHFDGISGIQSSTFELLKRAADEIEELRECGRESNRLAADNFKRAKVAEAARSSAGSATVTDEMVERAWAAIVGNDIAGMCFNAAIIRADLRTALESVMPNPAQPSQLAIENEQLRKTIQLHAGDAMSLSGELDDWRERALAAEEALAAAAQPTGTREVLDALADKVSAKIAQLEHYKTNDAQLDHAKTIAEGRLSQANQILHWIAEAAVQHTPSISSTDGN